MVEGVGIPAKSRRSSRLLFSRNGDRDHVQVFGVVREREFDTVDTGKLMPGTMIVLIVGRMKVEMDVTPR